MNGTSPEILNAVEARRRSRWSRTGRSCSAGAIEVGRLGIRFVKKAHLAKTPTVGMQTPTGKIRVCSPEATALDLVRYPEHAGSLSNVATVLHELAERLDAHALVRAAAAEGEYAYAQRLG